MIRIVFLMIVALHLVFGLSFQANAKVSVSEKNRYFNVTGKTGKQVYKQIRRRAPPELRRKRWIAATYAKYNYKQVAFGIKKNRCVATKVNIHLKLTYLYPRWKNRNQGSKTLQKKWRSFEKGLVRHEKAHGRIFREMVQAIEREIRNTKSFARNSCQNYIRSIKRKIRVIEKRYSRKQDAFDRKENRSTSTISKLESAFVKSN